MTTDAGGGGYGAPRFDVVLRGYDRRQVDEHVARLQRLVARMRADLEGAGSQPIPVVGGRPRPTPRPRPASGDADRFSDRMESILSSAEEEAAEIRGRARAEEQALRAQLVDLYRQRDAVLAQLARMRGQLEGLLSGPTARLAVPGDAAPRPSPSPRPPARPAPGPSGPGPDAGVPVPPPPAAAPVAPPSPPGPGPAQEPPRPAEARAAERASLRPRSEPEPEPGDLFRPSARPTTDRGVDSPTTVVPGTRPGAGDGERGAGERTTAGAPSADGGSDRTTALPPARPEDPDGAVPAAEGGVEATVQVSAVRPATDGPRDGRPAPRGSTGSEEDTGRDGGDPDAQRDRSNRSPSTSRSG